jgi:hypothetical protein
MGKKPLKLNWGLIQTTEQPTQTETKTESKLIQNLHITDINLFLRCPRRFKYEKKFRIVPNYYQTPEYFDIGVIGHKALAARYSKTPYEIPDTDNGNLIKSLMNEYVYEYQSETFEVLSVEDERTIVIDGQPIAFTFDLLYTDWTNPNDPIIRIMDHKFYRSLPDEDNLLFDFQITGYLWAARELKIGAKSLTLNCIRKEPPKYPDILDSGKLSKAQKSLNQTSYRLFLEAIEKLNLNKSDYQKELDFLQERGSNIVKRYEARRTNEQLDSFGENLRHWIKKAREEDYPIYSSSIFDGCAKCPYNNLCEHEDKKLNVRSLIQMDFNRKPDSER